MSGTRYQNRPYRATIGLNQKIKSIGYFSSAYEAAEHWDACARKIGKSPRLNFVLTKDLSHIILPKWLQ
jgi:hypothetical protein